MSEFKQPTIDEIYSALSAAGAHIAWSFPDGPWGWNEDGTSKAPTRLERAMHVCWYHDMDEALT